MKKRAHQIIAEIGTSHGGNLSKAKELIDAAKESGANTAKFQWVIADEIVSPHAGKIKLPNGDIDIYKSFKEVENDVLFYFELKEYCQKKDILFLCSIFGFESLTLLSIVNPDCIKIASPEVNYLQLISEIPAHTSQVILSDGISTYIDITRCIDILKDTNICILHCVTQYPATMELYQLSRILIYAHIFKCNTGISDHSTHPFLLPALACLLGSTCTEKHFTLNKKDNGLDDSFALEPHEFKLMCEAISYSSEIDISEHNISQLNIPHLQDTMEKLVGDLGNKSDKETWQELIKNNFFNKSFSTGHSPTFFPIYFSTRRSVFSKETIEENAAIKNRIINKRSETNLSHGASSEYVYNLSQLLSEEQSLVARKHIDKDNPLFLHDIGIQESVTQT